MSSSFERRRARASTLRATPRSFATGLLALAFAGCAAGAGVPELDASHLHRLPIEPLRPRELRLEVQDERRAPNDPEKRTVANVRDAMGRVLARSGLALRPDAAHGLTIVLHDVAAAPSGFSSDACIEIQGRLALRSGAAAEAKSFACFEYRHVLGFSMGADPTAAYETALNQMLDELDRQVRRLSAASFAGG